MSQLCLDAVSNAAKLCVKDSKSAEADVSNDFRYNFEHEPLAIGLLLASEQ